jgi:phosphatidate cytidylyltransferase
MLQAFFFQNIELSTLLGFLTFEIILLLFVSHPYRREKIRGWIIITTFLMLFFFGEVPRILGIWILVYYSCKEFLKLIKKNTWFIQIPIFLVFLCTILIFSSYTFLFPREFLIFFVLVSLSDIVAYFIGTLLPWKKGFTSLSPNKSLSGVLGQAVFLTVAVFFILFQGHTSIQNIILSISIGCLAPIGDLLESYFKRRAGVKDTADYIVGHGGILDRIDSSLLGIVLMALVYIFSR